MRPIIQLFAGASLVILALSGCGPGSEDPPVSEDRPVAFPAPMSYPSAPAKGPEMPSKQLGNVASGIIVSETDESLELDPTPCARDSISYTFYPPYRKSRLGTVRCNGRVYERYQVIEQR